MEELLGKLKAFLNIEENFTDDDAMLLMFLDVSYRVILNYCNGGLDSVPKEELLSNEYYSPVVISLIQYAAHLYTNRAIVTFQQGYELPLSFKFVLNKYVKY